MKDTINQTQRVRLHLACGRIILPEWINMDKNVMAPGVIGCDLLKGIPLKENTVDEIFTSHFLEHLKLRHGAIQFLQECSRVLKPGGILSIITPNFEILHHKSITILDMHFKRFRTTPTERMRWLVGATFGDGRTDWDYHASGWYPQRYKDLAESGCIQVDPAAGGLLKVWQNMDLVFIKTDWRPHSPYEVTAVYRKRGEKKNTYPTWLNMREIVGDGFLSPLEWKLKIFLYQQLILSEYPAALLRLGQTMVNATSIALAMRCPTALLWGASLLSLKKFH